MKDRLQIATSVKVLDFTYRALLLYTSRGNRIREVTRRL